MALKAVLAGALLASAAAARPPPRVGTLSNVFNSQTTEDGSLIRRQDYARGTCHIGMTHITLDEGPDTLHVEVEDGDVSRIDSIYFKEGGDGDVQDFKDGVEVKPGPFAEGDVIQLKEVEGEEGVWSFDFKGDQWDSKDPGRCAVKESPIPLSHGAGYTLTTYVCIFTCE